ncbi:SlyX family protein [Caldimonas tepidiphila]|uniref:SlyX family protein n=1 Tax=Caldimonas tepidiphila TaxID=2315841 RepID=UPI000E5ADC46|nr:SlyX family protein [Caldimonas tepidiphila]
MTQPNDIENRLIDLEVKASFTEDLVDHLNQTVVRQQQQIELLMRELAQMRQQMRDSGAVTVRSLREELPPHY